MEGSRPAKQGDQAILTGPRGIRGCFCIKFACHMYVDEMAHLELKVNGVTVNVNRPSHTGWQTMTTSVVRSGESMVSLGLIVLLQQQVYCDASDLLWRSYGSPYDATMCDQNEIASRAR